MKSLLRSRNIQISLALIAGIILGWGADALTLNHANSSPTQLVSIRENSPEYGYINPILITNSDRREYPEFDSLLKKVSAYISSSTSADETDAVSFYFRDMNSGKWTGINEDAKYNPGSMMKVAVLIGYLRDAEANPTILSKKIHYAAISDPGQYYKPVRPLQTGDYSVLELLNALIIESDNTSSMLLVDEDPQQYADIREKLMIPKTPDNPNTVDYMSAVQYSSLYRVLYNATYISRSFSDAALKLLTETAFDKGIVAGLPEKTVVAHKFGEHSEIKDGMVQSRELHDCGIVYYPEKPYLICIMTKGKQFEKLEGIIRELSRMTYEEVRTKGI
jgi:beta-lactamase class A